MDPNRPWDKPDRRIRREDKNQPKPGKEEKPKKDKK